MSNLIGHSLGRYHILEQLGEGGMAVVYKAFDTRLEADVAVKVIRTENILPSALDRTLKRFEREAKALARLTHPNIVKVTDYGEYEGKPYLVMPLLSGGTLKSKLNGKPMPWQEAAQILIPIADALGYAHKHDIIHRDVKPANILITENGQPMLADFGVAKMLDVEETMELTGTGVGLGTPEYMAPEQVTNKLVDARVDIYALGVVLFEMVTGRKPYIADTPMAVLIMHSRDPLPRPRSFAPNLPQEVENILFKALAKNPKDRFQNMADFAKAMEGVSSGKKFGAPKANEDEKRAEFKLLAIPRRAMITVGLIVLGLGLLAIFFKPLSALPAQLFAASTPTLTFTPAVSPTPTLSIGSTMISEKDGMTLDYVPAGNFTMGSDNGNSDEQPIHTVFLDAFWIDQTEVTNKQYAGCVTAGKCDAPSRTSSYTRDSYYGNSEFDEFPVIYMNWDNAKKYCEWTGRKLPTEAEWEKAARGTDQRTYPWGNDLPNDGLLNFNNSSIGDTTEVGKYPNGASSYGAYDMAGNVGEWVNDWYSINYYQNSPSSNPFGPNSSVSRVSRGGSWLDGNLNVRSASRGGNYPSGTYYFIGFRCALPITLTSAQTRIATPISTQIPTKTPDAVTQLLMEAFSYIKSSRPAYTFTFDQAGSWNFYLPENAKVSNGELVVKSGPRNRPEDPTDHWNAATIQLFTSHAIAVSFDFRMEGVSGQFTHCSFELRDSKSNGDIAFRNMYIFMPGGNVNIEQTSNNLTFPVVARGKSDSDFTQTNSATIILLDTNSVVYVNEEMIFIYKDPKTTVDFKDISLSANGTSNGLICHFDNFKAWDLGLFLESNK